MLGKSLPLNFKYVKPSLLSRGSSVNNKKTTSEDDLPDLASSSCASSDHEMRIGIKKRPQAAEEKVLRSIESDDSFHMEEQQQEEKQDDQDSSSIPPPYPLHEEACSMSDVLSAQQCQEPAVDREQRLVGPHCIPTNIVLLPTDLLSDAREGDSASTSSSCLEDRLEQAESLIHSYRATIRSNEHLIESLHQTLHQTREDAMNVISRHNELEQAVEEMMREEENDVVTDPKVFMKMAMATSLLLYFFGITTEYPLVAAVVVFLLEGFL